MKVIAQLAESDPKPFVILEASGKASKNRGQGVVISSQGHVLSAGHIAWIAILGVSVEAVGKSTPIAILIGGMLAMCAVLSLSSDAWIRPLVAGLVLLLFVLACLLVLVGGLQIILEQESR